MSLTSEEIEKTLVGTIQSMQKNMEDERKKFNDQITELENKLSEKEGETSALKEKIVLLTKNKDDKNTIESFKIERDGFSIDRGEYVYNWDDSEYRREEDDSAAWTVTTRNGHRSAHGFVALPTA